MLISIIIPIYNVEAYLEECLDSVFKETNSGCEVILVNDGSTDRSAQIIDIYKEKYPQIIIINKVNGGLSSARNSGLEMAKGKYLLFVDADDILEASILGKLLQNAENENADIAVADYYEFEKIEEKKARYDKSLILAPLVREEERLEKLFTIDVSFAVWNKLYKAEFLKQHHLSFLHGYWFEDLDFVFKAFYFAKRIVKTDGFLIGYRQRSGSIMKSISPKILDKMEIMDRIAEFLKKESKFDKYKEMYKILYLKMLFSIIYACVKNEQDTLKLRAIVNSLFNRKYFREIIGNKLLMGPRMK